MFQGAHHAVDGDDDVTGNAVAVMEANEWTRAEIYCVGD